MSASRQTSAVRSLCQGCGNCCRWPGEVILAQDEVLAIAAHLGLPLYEFTGTYTQLRRNRQGLTLGDQPDGSCIFLHQNRCAIQPVKPQQCRDFPQRWSVPALQALCQALPAPAGPP